MEVIVRTDEGASGDLQLIIVVRERMSESIPENVVGTHPSW